MGIPLGGFPDTRTLDGALMGEGPLASTRAMARLAAVALAGIAYIVGAFALTIGMPQAFALNADGTAVESVAPGSTIWWLGGRPGLRVEPWPADAPDPGFTFIFDDGLGVDVAARSEFPLAETVLLTLTFLAVALLTRWLGLPGSSVALGVSAAVALGPLAPTLGYPADLPLAAIPPAVTVLDIRGHSPNIGRSPWLKVMLAILVVGVLIPAVAWLLPEGRWPWPEIWKTSAWASVLIGIASAGPLFQTLLAAGSPDVRRARLVGDVFPIARTSRLEGSAAERRRLAAELHNEVLPQLGQAILEIDASDPAGRTRLSEVAAQIRRSMSERQQTTLEIGGLVAAIEGFVHQLDAPLELREQNSTTKRAPRHVEQAAYRVAQLAIANAVQHSGADAIRVELDESENELRLTIADDGVGIDELAEQSALRSGHVGLAEIRAQAQEVAAQLAIRSWPNEGTSVEFRWTR
jgi:signal transduction histidine kinase